MLALKKSTAISSDSRRHDRREVCLQARARISPANIYLACTVRNISPMGALIELSNPTVLPSDIVLQIPDDLVEVECSVRHQNGHRAGLMFTSNRQLMLAKYG